MFIWEKASIRLFTVHCTVITMVTEMSLSCIVFQFCTFTCPVLYVTDLTCLHSDSRRRRYCLHKNTAWKWQRKLQRQRNTHFRRRRWRGTAWATEGITKICHHGRDILEKLLQVKPACKGVEKQSDTKIIIKFWYKNVYTQTNRY